MFEVYRKEITWGGKLLTFETGKIARQADGAVMVTYGGTTVLCTAVGATSAKPGIDFFPLTVNYQEKVLQQAGSLVAFSKEKADHLKRKLWYLD